MGAITTWSCIKFDPYEMNTKKFRYALGRLRIGEKLEVCCGLAKKKRSISVPNFRNIHCSLSTRGTSSKDKPDNTVPLTLSVLWNNVKTWSRLHHVVATGVLASCIVVTPSAQAGDALKTYNCLLKECRIELAKCMANPTCAANIACVEICSTRPDEKECQMKCGDMFQNSVIDEFNACAISRKKCVPNKPNTGEFPVPNPEALVKSFNLSDFTGKWYISSGLNPIFDTFDCQAHEFKLEGDRLVGNMTWRIRMPDTGFITRSTVQKFVQDPSRPGILYNHDNEYLHYQDEWYIISSKIENKPSDYIFVYYRGRNDAWDGYGGAVIYTRSPTLPTTIIPELDHAAKSINHEFSEFTLTDNTCGPQPLLAERIKRAEEVMIRSVAREAERIGGMVLRLAKTELKLFQRLAEVFLIGGERC